MAPTLGNFFESEKPRWIHKVVIGFESEIRSKTWPEMQRISDTPHEQSGSFSSHRVLRARRRFVMLAAELIGE
jgi:hypothetical protein